MNLIAKYVISGLLGLLCVGAKAHGAGAGPQKPDNPPALDRPAGKPGAKPRSRIEEAELSPDQIKRMLDDFKGAQARFVAEERRLQRKLQNSSADARDKIREEIKEKREAFLEQQKNFRDEVQKRTAEMKDQLKDHKDLINEAKDQTKEKIRQRRGGDN
jgi:hypothetical protein